MVAPYPTLLLPRVQTVVFTNFSPHKENNVLGCRSIIRVDGSSFVKQKQNTERIKQEMDYQDIYRSQYMKADDLNGRTATYTVTSCTAETVGEDTKLVLVFSETDRPLVLNKTNAVTMAELHGSETDGWGGKQIKLVPATTQYQGKMVKCTRISPEMVG
jgi:hypothetical protein